MKAILKRFALSGLLLVVSYCAAVGYFYWQWLTPHTPLPEGIELVGERKLYNKNFEVVATEIEQLVEQKTKDWAVPSISVAYAIDDELVWAGASGFADIENRIPASTDSRYRAGSVSKSLTAMGLARLMDQNRIDIDESIHTYLPSHRRYSEKVTSRMLGNHTAGVRHYDFDVTMWPPHEFFIDTEFENVTDSLYIFDQDHLRFKPDSGFGYSSYGYNLLSAVMESAADQSFLTLMNEQVFSPLSMSNTGAFVEEQPDINKVKFYTSDGGLYGTAYPIDLSHKWASGGFLSTPSDLVKAGVGLLDQQYISDKSRGVLLSSVEPRDNGQDPRGYALGWENSFSKATLKDNKKLHLVSHSGGSVGGSSYLLIIPEYKVVVSVQANTSGGATGPYLDELAETIGLMLINSEQYQTYVAI